MDPRNSRITHDPTATFGCQAHVDQVKSVIDVSEGAQSILDNSQWHPAFSNFGSVPGANGNSAAVQAGQTVLMNTQSDDLDNDDDDDELDESEEEEIEALVRRDTSAIVQESKWSTSAARPSKDVLPFNLLQTSRTDITLYHHICTKGRFSPGLPCTRVICSHALHQKIPPGLSSLGWVERLNMTAQIPELNLVVIGNQVGRVGVLTMTRWHDEYGYRIECILPTKTQEEQGQRPDKELIGVAIGPIQGHEEPPSAGSRLDVSEEAPERAKVQSRRFRLMLTYYDHTVLTYEISRRSGEICVF